jgi:hypothetical protein
MRYTRRTGLRGVWRGSTRAATQMILPGDGQPETAQASLPTFIAMLIAPAALVNGTRRAPRPSTTELGSGWPG